MSNWFLVRDGGEQGPYDDAQLRKLAADGVVSPNDLIRRDGSPTGTPAKSIKGLFSAPAAAATGTKTSKRPPPPPARVGAAPSSVPAAASPPASVGTPLPSTSLPTSTPKPPSADWHYAQNNVQKGPIPFGQLKDLANTGRLRPTDLVWKVGTPNWIAARTVQGLFAIQSPSPTMPLQTQVGSPAPSPPPGSTASKNPKRVILIAAGATGVCFFLCCGGLLVIGAKGVEEAKATMAEADALWQSGKKTEAIAKYRRLVGRPVVDKQNGPRILGRLIEADVAAGDVASAERLIAEAQSRGIVPDVNSVKGKEMLAQYKEKLDKQEAEAELAKKKAKGRASGDIERMPDEDFIFAEIMSREYDSNEFAANEKYKGKRIGVAGHVFKVEDDFWGTHVILKGDQYTHYGVRCTLSKAGKKSGQLSSLHEDTFVKVMGDCDGDTFGIATLSNCNFVIADRWKFGSN